MWYAPSCSHPGLSESGRRCQSRCSGVHRRGRAARSCCPGKLRRRSRGASCASSVQSSCKRIRRAEPPAAQGPAGAVSTFPRRRPEEGCRPAPLVASARPGPRWSRQRTRLVWVIAWHLRESPESALQHRLRYRGERRRGWRLFSFSSMSVPAEPPRRWHALPSSFPQPVGGRRAAVPGGEGLPSSGRRNLPDAPSGGARPAAVCLTGAPAGSRSEGRRGPGSGRRSRSLPVGAVSC